jgi:hypothetical protein
MTRTIDPRIGHINSDGERVRAFVDGEMVATKHTDKGWRIFQDQSQSVILKFRVQADDWREKVIPYEVVTTSDKRLRAFVRGALKETFGS